MPEEQLNPDKAEIRRDLDYMVSRWHELPEPAVFEVRAFAEGKQPQILKFAPDWIDDAVDAIADLNARGRNVYVVRNPISQNCKGSASDEDIIASFFLWADCDDATAAGNVKRFDGPKYSAAITTGRTPETRVHIYWQLEQPCTDMVAWRDMQTRIAGHFKSDRSVINPSRIMRVAGTVSWPDQKKRGKGYINELVTLRTEYPDARPPVTLDQMRRVFGAGSESDRSQTGVSINIDTGPQPLDRALAAANIVADKEWRNNVKSLVASYVARGWTDEEILARCDSFTLAGYTVEDTRKDVASFIEWTRGQEARHGGQYAVSPNFDHAPAPTESDPSPASRPWSVQNASEFTADFVAPEYIIDGVIQRGRLYTLTAPTGSGKTAIMLHLSTAIASGQEVMARGVEGGDVLFLAGENPDDVRARVIAAMEAGDVRADRLHFIPGTFSIRADMQRLTEEAAKLPNLVLIVIDTFAAYFDGDDENSNAQALDFARLVRRLTALGSKPAVVMPAHPVKNASRGNLAPKGGSSLVNEVDGNLTLWKEGNVATLHWQVKIRGPEFEPLQFELERYESDAIRDSKGRRMPTVMAKPLLLSRAMELSQENMSLEDRVLLTVDNDSSLSLDGRGVLCGGVHKQKIKRTLEKLERERLVRRFRTNWELTKDGEKAVEMIRDGQQFAPEIE